ncbi:hypothetical protein D3C73_716130 [compost metagenome]
MQAVTGQKQLLLCPFYPQSIQVLQGNLPRHLLKNPRIPGTAHACNLRKLVHRNRFTKMLLHIADRTLYRLMLIPCLQRCGICTHN